ncbi:MAG: hypothetical protein ACT4NP_05240 [Pseudonocardiales bacterium]
MTASAARAVVVDASAAVAVVLRKPDSDDLVGYLLDSAAARPMNAGSTYGDTVCRGSADRSRIAR